MVKPFCGKTWPWALDATKIKSIHLIETFELVVELYKVLALITCIEALVCLLFFDSMTATQDLSDYEAYTDEPFIPVDFANGLVVSTNDPETSQMDILTSLKRLKFDLRDVNKKIKKSIDENYESLIDEFENLEKLATTINEINPALSHLNSSYKRLQKEIVDPYSECVKLHLALKKIHQTSSLLRSSLYFIALITKIETIDNSEHSLCADYYKNLQLVASLLYKLKHYIASTPYPRTLKIVRDYELFQSSLISHCVNVGSSYVKGLTSREYNDQAASNVTKSLMYLSPSTLYNRLQEVLTRLSFKSINVIARNFNNVNALESVFRQVSIDAKMLTSMQNVLESINWVGQDESNVTTVWDQVQKSLDLNAPLNTIYWRDIATGIEPRLKAIVKKGGPIARNLKDSKEEIKNVVRKSVSNSLEPDDNHDGMELTVMMNSIRCLD